MRVIILILSWIFLLPAAFSADAESPSGPNEHAFLSLKIGKVRVYQHEKIGLTVTLHYEEGLSIRDIQYPKLERTGFSAGEFESPIQGSETIDDRPYTTLSFSAMITPDAPGELRLGPAKLRCEVLLAARGAKAFFGGQEPQSLDLMSDPTTLSVLPLPREGRPAGFPGAVGNFDLIVDIQPRTIKAGDPLQIRTVIKGEGSLPDKSCPGIMFPSNGQGLFKAYPVQQNRRDHSLYCEQVVIPLTDRALEIPAITFSFFDPKAQAYRTQSRGPFPIKVSGKVIATTPVKKIVETSSSGKAPLRSFPGIALLIAVLALLTIVLIIWGYRGHNRIAHMIRSQIARFRLNRHLKRSIGQAGAMIASGSSEMFHTIIFRTLQEYLGSVLDCYPAGITVDCIKTSQLPASLDHNALEKIEILFSRCDRARYAVHRFNAAEMQETLKMMREVVTGNG